jgi:SAM-dependent methyltransferase
MQAISALLAAARTNDPLRAEEIELAVPFSNIALDNFRRAVELWNEHGRGLVADLPSRPCPACGHDEPDFMFQTFDGYPMSECADCGTWYVAKLVDHQLFERYFERSPEARKLALDMTFARLQGTGEADIARVTEYLTDLEPYLTASGAHRNYLDIGCNVGHSLRAAQALGYEAHGVEINPDAIRIARDRGLDVTLPEDITAQRVGVVSLWETLEHITDPKGFLEAVSSRLDDGGLLAFTIPNLNCADVRLLRNDCVHLHGGWAWPGHINMFGPASVGRLLERIGFSILSMDGQYGCNPLALVSYLCGSFRGIRQLLREGRQTARLSPEIFGLVNANGPYWTEIERASLASPILRVVACRTQDRDRFNSPEGAQGAGLLAEPL